MKNTLKILCLAILLLPVLASAVHPQKKKPAAPFKITDIKVVRFDEITGAVGETVTPDQWFGNDLSMSLLATVELSGPAAEFMENRRVQIRVTEGKKVLSTRTAFPGVFSETGKYYIPVFIYGPLCDVVKITATVTGQTTKATKSRNVNFHCGE